MNGRVAFEHPADPDQTVTVTYDVSGRYVPPSYYDPIGEAPDVDILSVTDESGEPVDYDAADWHWLQDLEAECLADADRRNLAAMPEHAA